jgi:hypothetical protein
VALFPAVQMKWTMSGGMTTVTVPAGHRWLIADPQLALPIGAWYPMAQQLRGKPVGRLNDYELAAFRTGVGHFSDQHCGQYVTRSGWIGVIPLGLVVNFGFSERQGRLVFWLQETQLIARPGWLQLSPYRIERSRP